MQLLIGVDVGSSGCKVTAINLEGTAVSSSTQTYPTRYPRPGWAEQDPKDWYRAACQAIRTCLASGGLDPTAVVGLAVDGPAHNVALMNDAGEVICPTIHWSDLRSVAQSEWLAAQYGERIFKITYQRVNPSWTLAQLLWVKENEAEVWSQLRRILVTKDYVRHRFTGTYQTDVYDAIGTQLYDVASDRWSEELCGILGFQVAWLPPVAPANAVGGKLLSRAASDADLPAGIPVAVGSGDSVVEALGVGVLDPGQGVVKVGTAANVNLVTAQPLPSAKTLTYRHLVNRRWFTITATNSGTSTLRWFRDVFCRHEIARTRAQGASAYELIGQLASSAPAGCEGLLFHPYLMGERSPYWDPRLRADFVGIGAHHQAQHFARATLEGVAFSIRDCLESVEQLGQSITELRLLGGGAKSPLWRQILCDVLGRPLLKPSGDAALGSALVAGVAVGLFPDWQAAVANTIHIEEILNPDPEAHALYDDYFDLYLAVARDLAIHSHRLAGCAVSKATTNPSTVE